MIYRNTLLPSTLQSPMQMLQNRTVRLQLPMSNAARQQLGLQTEMLRNKTKKKHLPLHDSCLGQNVMMQDPTSKRWSPAVITRLCKEPRSYQVTTKMEGPIERCKPISNHTNQKTSKNKRWKNTICRYLQTIAIKTLVTTGLAQNSAGRQVKPPIKLDLS